MAETADNKNETIKEEKAIEDTNFSVVNDIGTKDDILAKIDESLTSFRTGDIIKGTVISTAPDEALIDVLYKTEGVLPASEITLKDYTDPREALEVGQEIEAYVTQKEDKEGRLMLSVKRAAFEKTWNNLSKIFADNGTVKGTVIETVRSGLIVDIGVRAFVPASLIDIKPTPNLEVYLDQEIEAKIVDLDKSKGNIVLSKKAIIKEEQFEARQKTLQSLEVGQIKKGIISSIVPFGAFVNLGGIDGLIHVSELSWQHINRPEEVVSVGDEVDVKIIGIDKEKARTSLSLKATQEDPWQVFISRYEVEQILPAKITKVAPYGVFAKLENSIEGLVHLSEISKNELSNPGQLLGANQRIFVKIIEIDPIKKRVSLSISQANEEILKNGDDFNPALYGMKTEYDENGNYKYPEGFDPENNTWKEGYEEQEAEWQAEYQKAHDSWEGHKAFYASFKEKDDELGAEIAKKRSEEKRRERTSSIKKELKTVSGNKLQSVLKEDKNLSALKSELKKQEETKKEASSKDSEESEK